MGTPTQGFEAPKFTPDDNSESNERTVKSESTVVDQLPEVFGPKSDKTVTVAQVNADLAGKEPDARETGDKAPEAKAVGPADKALEGGKQGLAPPAVLADRSARYVPPNLVATIDQLLSTETNNLKKEILEKLKAEKSNAERIKLLEMLINGKLDPETEREILEAETTPEKKSVYEQLLGQEKEIETRYQKMFETVIKTLPDFKDHLLSGVQDQERQSIYLSLIREDGKGSSDKLKELLGLETDKARQDKIDSLINDRGDLDRSSLIKELLNGETDARKMQLLEQILNHEETVKIFGSMLDNKPDDQSIEKIRQLFADPNQAKRLKDLEANTNRDRNTLIDQMINEARKPELKQQLEKLKNEQSPEERAKMIAELLRDSQDATLTSRLHMLSTIDRKLSIIADLPEEESRRKEVFQALDNVQSGDYDAIVKAYPLAVQWLKHAVPEAFVEVGYSMGLPIPPGCPLKLPIEHGKPIPPALMEIYAKEGRIKLDMEDSAERLLNPAEKVDNVAQFVNSVEWLYGTKADVRTKQLKFEADALVETLRQYYGPEGVKKYGADGIPKNWMPPENPEDIPAWRDRVMQVVNLANRVRNYAQAMKSLDGIQNADAGLEELKKLGVEFEFGKNNQFIKFVIPALDGLDLRMQIPANHAPIAALEGWLGKHHKDVDRALDPYREAMDKLIASKDPKAFLRHGDFPYSEGLHPDVGVPYDVVKQRITSVKEEGGKIIVEGTVDYQTAQWYSYNYWFACENIGRNMTADRFRQVNGLAANVEPKVGEKYKIEGADGNTYEGWTYKGKNADGTLKFSREETFRHEYPAKDYVPTMTAMGNVQMVHATELNRWLSGWKLEGNPTKWELPQSTFWHHGLKWGKVVMDVGLVYTGGAGIAARGASWGARAMSLGRFAVGTAGLLHPVVDHKLPKEWRDGIHMASHAFILADVGLGLGLSTFKKAFGIGAAARESASLLSTIGHGAMAVDGILIYGPVVAADIKNVVDNHFGWTAQAALERALEDRGTPERLVDKAQGRPKFDLADEKLRQSMELMVDRLGQTVLAETTDAGVRERVQALVKEGKEAMALNADDPKRKAFVEKLSKMFSQTDEAAVWSEISKDPNKFHPHFRQEMQARLGTAGGAASVEEKMVAASLAIVLQANDKGELPETALSRKVTIPAHKELIDNQWKDVPARTIDVSVKRDELVGFVTGLAQSSDRLSHKMASAKLMWRMGKLDNNGLAGVLLDVAKNSNNRDLVGMALIDSKDISLGYLLNEVMHQEVLISKGGILATQDYRSRFYGLTADDLRRELKALTRDNNKSADARALALEVLVANDLEKVVDRKRALEECDRRWQQLKGKEGEYASDFIKALRYQAKQDVPQGEFSRKVKVLENGVEKEVVVKLTPDEARLEKFRALNALKQAGVIKVDGENYQMSAEEINANLIKCLSNGNTELSLAVIANLDMTRLQQAERRAVLGVLGWPNNGESQKVKVEVLKRIRDIVGGDRELALESKRNLLDMLNPGNRARPGVTEGDYSYVIGYADLHAATITALATFGAQYLHHENRNEFLTRAEFEARLAPGETKELTLGKYYQVKEGSSIVWYRYMGTANDGKEKFIKQGDPTVATIVQHLKNFDKIGSAKVRLAAAQAAGDLQIPGLRELLGDAIKKELDPRVAKRLREIKFPEEPPLDPKSDLSIEKLQEHMTRVRNNNQYLDLDHYGNWLKNHATYKIMTDANFKATWDSAVDGVYGTGFFSGIPYGWDAVGSWFGGKSPDAYFKDAVDGVDNQYTTALNALVKDAKTSSDAETRKNATMALLWIVVNRGADLPVRWREHTIDTACNAFVELSKQGSKERGAAVRWSIEKLLMQNPDLDPDRKMAILYAAVEMSLADKDEQKNDQAMTRQHLANVVYLAATAQAGFPAPSDPKYAKEVEYHKAMLNVLAKYCRDGHAAELLEALSLAHKSPEVRDEASFLVRYLRDGVHRNISDARKEADTTSPAAIRREAILANLSDPGKTTEDVVRSIAKAVEGYQWSKDAAADEALLSALRQANDDQRVRVKLLASLYMFKFGNGDDVVIATQTLHGITQTPYKYGDSARELKYYKEEAQFILSNFEKGFEKLPPDSKASMQALVKLGKEIDTERRTGALAHRIARWDANKTLATAQQELETLLNDPNAPEADLLKAIFAAENTHRNRALSSSDTVLDLYDKALHSTSEKVRLAAAFVIAGHTPDQAELEKAVAVLKAIRENGSNAQVKKEAAQTLDGLARLAAFSVGGINISRLAVAPSADRAKVIAGLRPALPQLKPEGVGAATRDLLSLASPTGKLNAEDEALHVLRDGLASKYLAVSLAAAMVLAEQSPNPNDVRKAIEVLIDIGKSNNPPRFKQDAESILNRLRDGDAAKAAVVNELDVAPPKTSTMVVDLVKDLQASTSTDLAANAARLSEGLNAAKDTPRSSTSDEAVKAIWTYGIARGAFAKDSPVADLIRNAATSHPDERVRMTAAWVMTLSTNFINDESTAYMVLARLMESASDNDVRVQSNMILGAREQLYKTLMAKPESDKGTKDLAQWALAEIEKHKAEAKKKPVESK